MVGASSVMVSSKAALLIIAAKLAMVSLAAILILGVFLWVKFKEDLHTEIRGFFGYEYRLEPNTVSWAG